MADGSTVWCSVAAIDSTDEHQQHQHQQQEQEQEQRQRQASLREQFHLVGWTAAEGEECVLHYEASARYIHHNQALRKQLAHSVHTYLVNNPVGSSTGRRQGEKRRSLAGRGQRGHRPCPRKTG